MSAGMDVKLSDYREHTRRRRGDLKDNRENALPRSTIICSRMTVEHMHEVYGILRTAYPNEWHF